VNWIFDEQSAPDGARLTHVSANGAPMSWRAVLGAWMSDAEYRQAFSASIAGAPFAALRWETPALSTAGLDAPYAHAILESPELARPAPDPGAFAEHFATPDNGTGLAVFANLGGDATLIAPRPLAGAEHYGHLAAFVRGAPAQQVDALWIRIAQAVSARLGERPIWLNTAGAGVPWLHVRVDARPKYYRHAPFRAAP